MARQIKSMEEEDAFTGWRHVMFWQRGELRRIKLRSSKRSRREGKAVIVSYLRGQGDK